MKRIIFFLVGLAITIALVVVVLTIDFSAGANNIYFNAEQIHPHALEKVEKTAVTC